ncbi:acetylornithine deacetylase [Komagataeibacter swingsii]|uniref:Acetylornithine deacetylase n=1 Tax=Komagataeibacter swingsii TaxID=215220 RepID=A0A2V4RJ61_9PROT|nr:acetylornithine deacetylase [Komagataeibacter swingsii]PYD69024.1 acetylornithine deacetylase [Komagataeibacter swingsii]GBQ56942.1 acetylornithine deacetylase [Komagataeibacter swingsii DSM 16373]
MKPTAPLPSDMMEATICILRDLIAFDTTSRNSNLALVSYIEKLASEHSLFVERIPDASGKKANVIVRVGPSAPGGIILSGHTDVVPVDGQAWTSDPFVLIEREGRLYGRGTSDMKSFAACALASIIHVKPDSLKRPVYLALSYDEEIGCLGAPDMIDHIVMKHPGIDAVIVGEPSGMKVVSSHKGIISYKVVVTGREGHSSLPHKGLSANEVAIRLMNHLVELADQLQANADPHSPYEPGQATLTIGLISGGTAFNILAQNCEFSFDLRCRPEDDAEAILAPFLEEICHIDTLCRSAFPECGVSITKLVDIPSYGGENNSSAIDLCAHFLGTNTKDKVVPYSSEGGQFQSRGLSTVICGPGMIEQAHQADEFIEKSQLQLCLSFMSKILEYQVQPYE